jgi:hypothetical protein
MDSTLRKVALIARHMQFNPTADPMLPPVCVLRCFQPQIVEGRLEKIKRTYALLEQPALRDNNKTVAEIIKEAIAATGENIQVRFVCSSYCAMVSMGVGLQPSGRL